MLDADKIFDGLLVLEYKAGNKEALSLLVNRHHKKLCKHAFWYTHDMDSAKDIAQDCWSIIITKIYTLRDPNLFGSWALRIVTRKSLDRIKNEKREFNKRSKLQILDAAEDDAVGTNLKIAKLQNAIEELSNEQQQVLRLFYKEDYSLREISHILNISQGTVKSRLFHAREKLKSVLR